MIISTRTVSLSFILLFFAASCSSPKYLQDKEKLYGTGGKNNWVFHRLADRDKGLSLAFPGYIIGVEKAKREKIGAPNMDYLKEGQALKRLGFNRETYLWEPLPFQKRFILNDRKPTFISHIKEYELSKSPIPSIQVKSLYDIYNDDDVVPSSIYDKGNLELLELGNHLRNQIKEKDISHVFFLVMGWNSGQQEAIRNFNSLFLKILKHSEKEESFKPLFIAMTWPSHWNDGKSNVFSFFNKTNDADEIGMMWANLLLNRELLNTKYNQHFKTIVIGHSFGSKLTSRAVMSASMLENKSRPVDLLINLQSAYSINRFSFKSIEETNDYQNWQDYANHIALVWSEHDKAVTKGFYAPFAGGKKAYKKVTSPRSQEYFSDFETKTYNKNSPIFFTEPKQIFLINGSDIIKYSSYNKGGKAHSDIYNDQVSHLIWNLIKSSTLKTELAGAKLDD